MNNHVPISVAAFRLGMTYHQVRAQVLQGRIKGGKDDFGRFYVDSRDVDRLASARIEAGGEEEGTL